MSPTTEKKDYGSTTFLEQECTINGEDYVLVEASGFAETEYTNKRLAAMRFGPTGKLQQFGDLANVEAALVARCLFKVKGDKREAVTVQRVEGWPYHIKKALFEDVKKLSPALAEAEKEKPQTKERDQLLQALSRDDSPVKLADLRTWLNTLPDKEFKDVQDWIKETEEELAKNSPSATILGSD